MNTFICFNLCANGCDAHITTNIFISAFKTFPVSCFTTRSIHCKWLLIEFQDNIAACILGELNMRFHLVRIYVPYGNSVENIIKKKNKCEKHNFMFDVLNYLADPLKHDRITQYYLQILFLFMEVFEFGHI